MYWSTKRGYCFLLIYGTTGPGKKKKIVIQKLNSPLSIQVSSYPSLVLRTVVVNGWRSVRLDSLWFEALSNRGWLNKRVIVHWRSVSCRVHSCTTVSPPSRVIPRKLIEFNQTRAGGIFVESAMSCRWTWCAWAVVVRWLSLSERNLSSAYYWRFSAKASFSALVVRGNATYSSPLRTLSLRRKLVGFAMGGSTTMFRGFSGRPSASLVWKSLHSCLLLYHQAECWGEIPQPGGSTLAKKIASRGILSRRA